jgi:hypothetical protein
MSSSVSLPVHRPDDWVVVWAAPKRRRWWQFWRRRDKGETYLAKVDPAGPTTWSRVR